MHPKLKKCLKCGKPMRLNPMQTGKLKCRGYVAQCTACDYSHSASECDYGEATRMYNLWFKFKTKRRRVKKVFFVWYGITVLFCTLAVLPGFEQVKWELLCVGSFCSGVSATTAVYGIKR